MAFLVPSSIEATYWGSFKKKAKDTAKNVKKQFVDEEGKMTTLSKALGGALIAGGGIFMTYKMLNKAAKVQPKMQPGAFTAAGLEASLEKLVHAGIF